MRKLLGACCLFLLAACESGAIEGHVVVGPGHDGLAVLAVLWQRNVVKTDPANPDSPTREELVAIGQLAVGTATEDGGRFPFRFHSLGKGEYLVGAFADLHDDRLVTVDELSVDTSGAYLTVDPSNEESRRVLYDVYLGLSAPDRGTLRGVLHRSASAASGPVELLVLDAPISDPKGKVVARRTLPAGSEDLAWTVFNVPPGDVHVFAMDDLTLEGRVAISAENPLRSIPGAETRTELWMERQAPALGRVAGTVTLNGALSNARLQLYLFSEDPTKSVSAPMVALVNVPVGGRSQVPFEFRSTRLGKLWLAGEIATLEPDGRRLRTSRVWSLGTAPSSFTLALESPTKEGIVFPMGVGRISGELKVQNARRGLELWAIALRPGEGGPVVHQYDVFTAPASGNVTLRYELFGLEDGVYDMQVVPDVSGADGPNDEIASGYFFNGSPPKVEIVGGDRVVSHFTISLPSP